MRPWCSTCAYALSVFAASWTGGSGDAFAGPEVAKPTPGKADYTDMTLEELMNVPVYAASRRTEPLADAPALVTVITSQDIKRYGYRTLRDVLKSVGGFYVTYDCNYAYVGVRGFNTPGDYNTKVLVLINGLRSNEIVYDSSGADTDFNLDIDLIERIEVVRGPASALYGTSAFFAVINVITRRAVDPAGAEVAVHAASHDTYKTRVTASATTKGGIGVLGSATVYRYGGQSLYYKQFESDAVAHGRAPPAADRDAVESAFLSANRDNLSFHASYVSRTKHIPTAPWGTAFGDDRTHTVDKRFIADAGYEGRLSDKLDGVLKLAYNWYDYCGDYAYDYAGTGIPADHTVNRDTAHGDAYIAEVGLSTDAIPGNKLTFGWDYRINAGISQRNYDEDPYWSYLDRSTESTVWALYAQDTWMLNEIVSLLAGIRYDHYSTFGGQANPRAGAILKPASDTTLKYLYGKAFRAPNAYEMYYSTEAGTQKGNQYLQPEEIRTHAVILEQKFSSILLGTISVFQNEIGDLIALQTDPNDNMLVFNNVDEVRARGCELELTTVMPGGLEGRASYTFTKTVNTITDEQLINSPEHLAKLNVSAALWRERILGGIEAQYVGKRKTLASDTIAGYVVMNVTLIGKDLAPGTEMSVSVYNIFDKAYCDPAGEEHAQDRIRQDGRSIRAGIVHRF